MIVFENPRFITCYDVFENFLSFSMCLRMSRDTFLRFSFCYLVRILGTSLAQIFWMPNSKIKISCDVWRFKFNTLLIILSNVDQTTRSLTLVTSSSVFYVQGLPERGSSCTLSRPSTNVLCHPPKNLCPWYSMLSTSPFLFFEVSVAFSLSLTQNLIV